MTENGATEPDVVGSVEIKTSEIKTSQKMSSETALTIARHFAAQWGAEYPFGFLVFDVWYVFPNANTVLIASTAEEADALTKPLPS